MVNSYLSNLISPLIDKIIPRYSSYKFRIDALVRYLHPIA
jgi:hypothetical protein